MQRAVAVVTLLATLGVATTAHAIPRYSARYRQNCTLCHQNPTGGGLRSLYASQFLVPTEMAIKPFGPEKIERIHPDLSSSVNVGADFRAIHVYANLNQRPERNFFQMQGDLYVSFSADDHFSANLNVDQVGSVEAYGLGWVLPWSGYVKVGRFTPVFGWKFADHNNFNREELSFDQPFNTDAGVELGIYPRQLAVWASVLNGEPGSNTIWDSNREPAFAGGALVRFNVSKLGLGVGGSVWSNAKEPRSGAFGRRMAGGPFGYLGCGPLTYLWEVDASRLKIPGTSAKTALLTTHEIGWQVRPGFDVVATYNYVDRDLDFKTGTRSRYGIGIEAIPTPFVQIQAAVNRYETERGLEVSDPDFTRSEVQLHLFY